MIHALIWLFLVIGAVLMSHRVFSGLGVLLYFGIGFLAIAIGLVATHRQRIR